MKFARYCSALLGLLCCSVVQADVLNIAPESVDAQAWLVLDTQSGQVIAQHQSDVQRAPASLTKMMVAYITLKDIQAGRLALDEVITANDIVRVVKTDESRMKIKVGQQISIDQLLAGLIVMSANDGALLLAQRISGDVPRFVERMNQEAKALGMHNTHFENPPGITMPNHYSTAKDLALLAQAVVKQTPHYLHYSKMPEFVYQDIHHHATNLLLARDASVDGLKTGFTQAAGYNLALTAKRSQNIAFVPQRRLIVLVLGTENAQKRAEVAHRLLNVAYQYTRNELPIQPDQHIASIPVQHSKYTWFHVKAKAISPVTVSLYPNTTPISLREFDQTTQRLMVKDAEQKRVAIEPVNKVQLQTKLHLPQQQLTAPLEQQLSLAQIEVYQGQELLRRFEVHNQVNLPSVSFMQRSLDWLNDLVHGVVREAKILVK